MIKYTYIFFLQFLPFFLQTTRLDRGTSFMSRSTRELTSDLMDPSSRFNDETSFCERDEEIEARKEALKKGKHLTFLKIMTGKFAFYFKLWMIGNHKIFRRWLNHISVNFVINGIADSENILSHWMTFSKNTPTKI